MKTGKNLGVGQNVEHLGNGAILEKSKTKPSGKFQEEAIAVVFVYIVWMKIAGKSEENDTESPVYR